MTRVTYSIRPGAVFVRILGGRATWLYCIVGLAWLSSANLARAESESGKDRQSARTASSDASEKPTKDVARSTAEVVAEKIGEPTFRRIGPVTTITECSSGLPFPARVDTGATTCSIHYEEIEIEDPAENPEDNVGKQIRVLIQNPDGEKQWVSTKIVEHVTVRTSTDDDLRYKVPLKLRWQDVEKKVLVTLKDRERMQYPLLLGRNFLKGDFIVDVNLDAE